MSGECTLTHFFSIVISYLLNEQPIWFIIRPYPIHIKMKDRQLISSEGQYSCRGKGVQYRRLLLYLRSWTKKLKSRSRIASLSCVSVWDGDLKVCYIDLDKEESAKMNLLGRVGMVFLVVINIFFLVSFLCIFLAYYCLIRNTFFY